MKTIELQGVGVERAFKVMRVMRDGAGLAGKQFPLEMEVFVTGECVDLYTGKVIEVEEMEIAGFARRKGTLAVEVFDEGPGMDCEAYLLVPVNVANWTIACSAIN
jgi:hypothetical protein